MGCSSASWQSRWRARAECCRQRERPNSAVKHENPPKRHDNGGGDAGWQLVTSLIFYVTYNFDNGSVAVSLLREKTFFPLTVVQQERRGSTSWCVGLPSALRVRCITLSALRADRRLALCRSGERHGPETLRPQARSKRVETTSSPLPASR